jgi:hypothetical protein
VSGAFIHDDDNVLSFNIITGESLPTLLQNFRILLFFLAFNYLYPLHFGSNTLLQKFGCSTFEQKYTSTISIVARLHSEEYLWVHYLVIRTWSSCSKLTCGINWLLCNFCYTKMSNNIISGITGDVLFWSDILVLGCICFLYFEIHIWYILKCLKIPNKKLTCTS